MRKLNGIMRLLKPIPLKSATVILVLVLSGAFLLPTESRAQAVPPRVQGLMINRPIVPPPEPPVQKEIRELNQGVRKNTKALDQKIEAFLGLKPPPRLDVGVPAPPPRPKFSRDEEIRLLEVRLQKLREELIRVSRRLDDLKKQPSKKCTRASKPIKQLEK
jgi:hypothetical protein